MNKTQLLLALSGSLLLGWASTARADATSDADLLKEINSLKARINELESKQDNNWLNERRQEEVKSLVRDVLSDADMRSSLQAEGMTAGHNGSHFFLASADGSFLMNVSGQVQMRYVYDHRNSSGGGEDAFGDPVPSNVSDENQGGFELTRTKIQFDGHVASPKITYAIRLAVDRNTDNVIADRIVLGYKLMDNLTISGGEDYGPFLRESLTDSAYVQAVDRSIVTDVFTIGRIQGVWANWEPMDMLKVAVAMSDGARSGDAGSSNLGTLTTTRDEFGDVVVDDNGDPIPSSLAVYKAYNQDRSDFAVTGRVDLKIAGDWKQMQDYTAWSGEPFAAFVGGAIHYEVGETGDFADNNKVLSWTVDGSVETNGLNVAAAIVGTSINYGALSTINMYGIVVQGGYNINDKLEPFIRWEYIDTDNLAQEDTMQFVTFGANYFLNKHRAKFTLDVVYGIDPVDPLLLSLGRRGTGLGVQGDDPGKNGQVAIRAQFQLLF